MFIHVQFYREHMLAYEYIMRRSFITILFTLGIFFVISGTSFAAGVIPCGDEGNPCQACHLVQLGQNVITTSIGILVGIMVLIFVYAGIKVVMAGGSTSGLSEGKKMMTNAVVGFVIILSSWLIIDTALKVFVSGDIDKSAQFLGRPWNKVECTKPIEYAPWEPVSSRPTRPVGTSVSCPDCVPITQSNLSCKHGCSVAARYAEELKGITTRMEITEAIPPKHKHRNSCHLIGTCTDIVFTDRVFTPERVRAFQEEARRAGMRAVFEPAETFNGGSCRGYSECQPFSVTKATGSHFSLYMD